METQARIPVEIGMQFKETAAGGAMETPTIEVGIGDQTRETGDGLENIEEGTRVEETTGEEA
jgi:hypothetical protein